MNAYEIGMHVYEMHNEQPSPTESPLQADPDYQRLKQPEPSTLIAGERGGETGRWSEEEVKGSAETLDLH